MTRTVSAMTSAADTVAGFEYQYYFFLLTVIEAEPNESVGYEVIDDIHLRKGNGDLVLLQLKHSTIDKPLTDKSVDIWKTLANWVRIATDPLLRKSEDEWIAFVDSTEFHLVTNRQASALGNLKARLGELGSNPEGVALFRQHIETILAKASNKTRLFAKMVTRQSDRFLAAFLPRIVFSSDATDLVEKCKKTLEQRYRIRNSRRDDVFQCLDSRVREKNYFSLRNRIKCELTADDISSLCVPCIEKARESRLTVRDFKSALPQRLFDQTFIKQLVDIGDVRESAHAIDCTNQKLLAQNNLAQWEADNDITSQDRAFFEQDCIAQWATSFRRSTRDLNASPTEQEITMAARQCLDDTLKFQLQLINTDLGPRISNGVFFAISDIPMIGWRFDWRRRYGDHEDTSD